ncbi:MAG TPA: hypothetical protein VL970_13780 [Candidatus Acidoferrales bacterium]|nr:hypothetical protein [Candidatus Acidoferrales bacterium]
MKKTLTSVALALLAGQLVAADSNPKDEVVAAAKKLGAQPNYSWKQNVVVPEDAPFKPGPTEGKLEKGGVTYFTSSFGDNTTKIYLQSGQSAISNPDGGWQSAKELENDEGPGRFMAFLVRAFKAPAGEAEELAGTAGELKADGDVIAGDMTEAGAKSQFRFGTVTNPKGSVKFWLKDGQLLKYEFKLTGKAEFNGNEFDVDRDTTTEITDVGTTKIEVPAEAKKKLEPAPAPVEPATNGPAAKGQ